MHEFFGEGMDGYDLRHYQSGHRTYMGDRLAVVRREFAALRLPPGSVVLDVACGPGHFLDVSLAAGMVPLGVDYSMDMLRVSQRRLGDRVALARADAGALPFADGTVDAINCSGLLEYLDDPGRVLREFKRVLRPGAPALVSSSNRRAPAYALTPLEDLARGSRAARAISNMLRLGIPETAWRPREFKFRFHTAAELQAMMEAAGFPSTRIVHYHLQLLPHPADRVLPSVTSLCVRLTDPLLRVPLLRDLSEGLLAVGRATS